MASNLEKIKQIIASDKRYCERLELPLKIRYRITAEKKQKFADWSDCVWLDNVGGEGLGFSSDVSFKKGEKLDIELKVPTETSPFFFGAEIVWIHKNENLKNQLHPGKYYYGLRFYQLSEEVQKDFERFIADNIIDKYLDEQGQLKDV